MEALASRGWRELLVGDRAFYRQVMGLLIPMFVQNTVTNVCSLLDNLMVGAVGAVPMASVAIVNQLLFVFNLCVFGGLSGAGIFSTQYAGARDMDGVRHCFRVKLVLVAVIFVCALALLKAFPAELIGLYLRGEGRPEELDATLALSREYLAVMVWGLPAFALSMMYASTLRELGEVRVPMVASVVSILLNVAGNYVLIFGKFGFPCLGVVGAALATVAARYLELLINLAYTHLHPSSFPFIVGAYRTLAIPRALALHICQRGVPLLVNELCWSVSMAVLLQCYSRRGLHVITAVNIAMTVAMIFNCAFFSMGGAVSVMVGHELGAGRLHESRSRAWRPIWLTGELGVAMAALTCLCAPFVPRLYDIDDATRHLATNLLLLGTTVVPLRAFAHASYFVIRSGGRSGITFLLDSGYNWLVTVSVTAGIGYLTDWGILPFYLLSQWSDGLKALVAAAIVRSGVWIRNIVAHE